MHQTEWITVVSSAVLINDWVPGLSIHGANRFSASAVDYVCSYLSIVRPFFCFMFD